MNATLSKPNKTKIKIKTEEYLVVKNNIRINCYLSTFNINDIEYALIHLGGYSKLDKYLIAGEIPENILYTIGFSHAYFWGISVWNQTYISGKDQTEMIIFSDKKTAQIYTNHEATK